jgi:hypothetical protein
MCWLSFYAEIQNGNMRIYFSKINKCDKFLEIPSGLYIVACIACRYFISWELGMLAMVIPWGWWEKYCQFLFCALITMIWIVRGYMVIMDTSLWWYHTCVHLIHISIIYWKCSPNYSHISRILDLSNPVGQWYQWL